MSAPASSIRDLDEGLRALGYSSFRPGQREAIEHLLAHGRLLLVAPTGGGKSLSYQLPAMLLSGTTVVVSPLISLMHDQVESLQARGVSATYLASTLESAELRRRMAKLAAGEFRIVYIAPERLAFAGFRELLRGLRCPLVAIDEAHCISEWGHDFRPEYLSIGSVLEELAEARVLACTATATPVVRDEILSRLGLPAGTRQLVHGFSRPNLVLRAREVASGRERADRVDELLDEALGGPKIPHGSAILYAPTRARCEDEANRLGRHGYRCAAYHAGMNGSARARVQERFMNGKLDVIVATNAFGMGVDRADVRAVIHLAPPGSVEAYYQEVGRAGRDGERAWGLVLHTSQDLPLRRRLIEAPIDGRVPSPAIVEHKWALFLELVRWLEGGTCRHDAIVRYFGAHEEALGGCGQCDQCQALDEQADVGDEEAELIVRKALSGVARVHCRFGMRLAIALLRGQSDPRLARAGLERVSTFGVLADWSEPGLVRLLRRCVTAGWVGFTGSDRPVVMLTDEGREAMKGQRPARLLLPPDPGKKLTSRGEVARKILAVDQSPQELELFERLRAHRLTVAQANGVPPYVVASDRTLLEMARLRPRTPDELLQVHGVGPAKLDRFGDGFLQVVAAY